MHSFSRKKLLSQTVSAILLGSSLVGTASAKPPLIQLGDLDGRDGFRLDGEAEFNRSGGSVSNAGDILTFQQVKRKLC